MVSLSSCAAPLISLLLLPAVASAQLDAEIVADTPLIAQGGGQIDTKPRFTVLLPRGGSGGGGVSIMGGGLMCPYQANSGAIRTPSSNRQVYLRFSSTATYGGLCPPTHTSAGPHAVLMRFFASYATPATVRIQTAAPIGVSSYAVDVGNDGSIELSSATTSGAGLLDVPVTLVPGRPLPVRVETAANSRNGPAEATVDVTVIPGPVFPSYGSSCSAILTAYHLDDPAGVPTLQFDVTRQTLGGGPPFPFYVFGVRQLGLSVPPTNCRLLTDTLVAVPGTLSGSGTSELSVAMPPGSTGAQFNVQFLTGYQFAPTGVVTWFTSNASRITLP